MAKTKKNKYKNISGVDQVLIGVGEVGANKTIETNEIINNPNFRMIGIDPVVKQKRKLPKKG